MTTSSPGFIRASDGSWVGAAAVGVGAAGAMRVGGEAGFAGAADVAEAAEDPGFGAAAGVAGVAPVAAGTTGAPARLTSKRLGPFGVTAVRVPVLFGEAVFVLAGGARAAPLDDFAFASVSVVTAGVESQAVISRTTNSPAAVTTRDIL